MDQIIIIVYNIGIIGARVIIIIILIMIIPVIII